MIREEPNTMLDDTFKEVRDVMRAFDSLSYRDQEHFLEHPSKVAKALWELEAKEIAEKKRFNPKLLSP